MFSSISARSGCPKNVKLFLQSHAGVAKNGKKIFKHTVAPLFQNAGVGIDMTGKLN